MASVPLSRSEQDVIRQGCREDCRIDGRSRFESRYYTILASSDVSQAPLLLSSGSARLLGPDGTHLLCSVKAEVVRPSSNHPDQGIVEIYVESLTPSTLSRISQDELQATLTLLLARNVVDLESLCIVPYEYAWRLHVDLYVIQHNGSILDVASQIIRAALSHTLLPQVTAMANQKESTTTTADTTNTSFSPQMDLSVDADITNAKSPSLAQSPVIVTVSLIPPADHSNTRILILDATAQEEACAVAQIHVAVVNRSAITAVQTRTQGASIPWNALPEITQMALQSSLSQYYHVGSHKDPSSVLPPQFSIQ